MREETPEVRRATCGGPADHCMDLGLFSNMGLGVGSHWRAEQDPWLLLW